MKGGCAMTEATPGTVVSVRASVVEFHFAGPLHPIYSVLRAGEAGRFILIFTLRISLLPT